MQCFPLDFTNYTASWFSQIQGQQFPDHLQPCFLAYIYRLHRPSLFPRPTRIFQVTCLLAVLLSAVTLKFHWVQHLKKLTWVYCFISPFSLCVQTLQLFTILFYSSLSCLSFRNLIPHFYNHDAIITYPDSWLASCYIMSTHLTILLQLVSLWFFISEAVITASLFIWYSVRFLRY